MTTSYPAAADSFRRANTNDSLEYLSNLQEYDLVDSVQDAVEAIEAELGTDPAGSDTDVKTRLAAMDTAQATEDTALSTAQTDITTNATAIALNTLRAFGQVPTAGAGATSVSAGAAATQTITVTLTAELQELGNASTGLGFDSTAVLVFPAGSIYRVESVLLELAAPGGLVGLDGADNGDIALGTTATVAGALTDPEDNFITSAALAYDTAVSLRLDTAFDVDATSGAITVYLNSTVDDGDVGDLSVTTADWTATGTITVTFTDLGGLV